MTPTKSCHFHELCEEAIALESRGAWEGDLPRLRLARALLLVAQLRCDRQEAEVLGRDRLVAGYAGAQEKAEAIADKLRAAITGESP